MQVIKMLYNSTHDSTGELGYPGPLYAGFLTMTDSMLGPSPMHINYVYWTMRRPDSATTDQYHGTQCCLFIGAWRTKTCLAVGLFPPRLRHVLSGQTALSSHHLVVRVADKYMYNKSPARHILSLFWLLYLSIEVPNAIAYTPAYDGLSPTYAYDGFCIWWTNFPGSTGSVISEFACISFISIM